MKDQYKKETSQIHAPADLVQKTKLAMQQEEQRLKESADKADRPDITVGMQREYAADGLEKGFKSSHRIYKWSLPLSAAAAVLILVSVSAVMRTGKSDYSASDMMADSGYEKRTDEQFSEAASAEDTIEENEMLINEGPAEPTRKDAEEDYPNYAMKESMEAAIMEDMEPTESTEGVVSGSEESAADTESGDVELTIESDSGTAASTKTIESSAGTDGTTDSADAVETKGKEEIEITVVEEEPTFYYSPGTESYQYENLLFWADQEENGDWFAYVSVRGDKYVIVSTIKDQEEFLEKAYELLSETRELAE